MRSETADWKYLSLDEVCSFHRGLTYSKKDEVDASSNAVLRANNVSLDSGELDLSEIRYIDDRIEIPAHKKVKKGSLLVCMASGSKKHLGKVALIDDDYQYAFGGFMGLLVPNDAVEPKYLYWITRSKSYADFIMGLSDGANINNLKFSQLGQYQLPVPPLPEQKRIVAVLDEAFAGIATAVANTEKNLANARELFESYLEEVFCKKANDWEKKKLGEITMVQSGGTPLRSKPEYWNGDVPWYSSGELNDLVTVPPARYITSSGLRNSNAKLFPEGSLLIGMYDTAALKMAILDRDAAFNQAIAAAAPAENLDLRFVFFAINAFKQRLLLERRGVRQKNLSLGKIKNIELPIPPLSTQRNVADSLLALAVDIDRLQAIVRGKLAALSELNQSLLQKAFSGELNAAPQGQIEAALA